MLFHVFSLMMQRILERILETCQEGKSPAVVCTFSDSSRVGQGWMVQECIKNLCKSMHLFMRKAEGMFDSMP